MTRTLRTCLSTAVLLALPAALAAQSFPGAGFRVGARPKRARPPASVDVITFEGSPAGTVVSQLFTAAGAGPIAVHGFNPFLGAANAALLFDTAFPTGGDFDLGTPHIYFGGPGMGAGGASGPFQNDEPRGMVLIIAENLVDWDNDGLVNSPDDLNAAATTNATLRFDFAAIGPVTLHGLTVIDVEASELPPFLTYLDADGAVLGTFTLPATGDNGVAEVELGGVEGVSQLVVHMRGSGAIDDLRLSRVPLGSIAFVPDLTAVDLTPDGGTALLFDQFSSEGDVYFYDVASDVLTPKTTVGTTLRAFPTGISATERVSAVHGEANQAGLWTEAGGWLDLGSVYPNGCVIDPDTGAQDKSGAWDLSADGSVAVGLLWNECNAEAFRWTSATGLVPLELLGASFPDSPNPPSNRATKISDDGSLVGGFAQTAIVDRWPAIWRANGEAFLLPQGPFTIDSPGEILSVSADGSRVAGIWNLEGFTWTEADGVVSLGFLPGGFPGGQTFPNAIAADGQLIFGKTVAGFFDPPTVFVWTEAQGMRSLSQIAAASGVSIPAELTLDNVLAASTDGTVVLGTAFDFSFRIYTFVLRLPISVYGL
jgi:hypothetical protein